MLYIKYIFVVCFCLIGLLSGQSSETSESVTTSTEYDDEDDEEFAQMLNHETDNESNRDKMMITGRAREGEYDEFENFNEEFERDKFAMDERTKNKDDMEFQNEFDDDKDGLKDDHNEFYQAVKDELEGDVFNIDSSNKIELNARAVDDDSDRHDFFSDPKRFSQRQYEQASDVKVDHHDDDEHWTKPPLECDCDVKAQAKIIGGSNAPKGRYPFAVAIFTLVGRGSFCGATLVNHRYVLTAAHCVQRHYRTPKNYNVVAGRTDLNISDILEDFITKASHIWLNGQVNDVALVRLSEHIEFSDAIKPACFGGPAIVPKDYSSSGYNKFGFDHSIFNNLENVASHFKQTNRSLTAIGWGYVGWRVTKVNGVSKIRPIMTTKLQEVELNEVICTKEEYLICVEGKGKSPCFGDSGSPLLYNYYDKMVVVGLTSRSSSVKTKRCLGAPTIYERSAYYLPWIKTLTANQICIVN